MKSSKTGLEKSSRRFTSLFPIIVALAFLSLGAASVRAFAQKPNPYAIAAEHAAHAVQAKQLKMIHEHLHHVLNCLEGPSGKDFDASAGNPCAGSKGALQTLPKNSADHIRAQKAIALARVGVTLHDKLPAHYVAEAVHAILTEGRKR